jgi:hypothetical protein
MEEKKAVEGGGSYHAVNHSKPEEVTAYAEKHKGQQEPRYPVRQVSTESTKVV